MNAFKTLLATLAISLAGQAALAASVTYVGTGEDSRTSRAVLVEGYALAHTGQMMPLDKQGTVIGEGVPSAQLTQVFFNLQTALVTAGSDIKYLVKMNVYVDTARTAAEVRKLFNARFPGPTHPAVSFVCTPLAHPKALVALDAVAIVPGEGPTAVVRNRCPILSGDDRQGDVAVLPRGDVVYLSTFAKKAEPGAAAKCLGDLLATIGRLGLDRNRMVQLKAFLPSLGSADAVREQVTEEFAGKTPPPLILVQSVSDAPFRIEMIASAPAVKSGSPPETTASSAYSSMARAHDGLQIYLSGLYSDEPGDAEAQVRGIVAALGRISKETHIDLRHLVKSTAYVSDTDAARALVYPPLDYFDQQRPPAASTVMVKDVGMAGRSVTLDLIAVPPQ